MAIFKCKMCGGDLNVTDGMTVAECEYCCTKQTVSCSDDEKRVNLYNRANRLRINSEFDKAASIYESIVAEFPEEAEAYWGLVICNYGIEYVDDPATAKKIPTCHRASFESIQNDDNYKMALEYADVNAQKVYRDEAREIDRIREEILAISKNEKPYDIFICYKETDDKGERTIDSVIAQDVYDALTEKGYKVFFSRISLEDKLGRQYEPYIFAALNSAKVMLSFGTKYEYFHAVWVKNEWSRFLKLMAKDKSKVLIPCYKDMDAYDIPEEFKALQAQDLGKVGATQDLLRGIGKVLGNNIATTTETVATANNNVSPLLERAFMALEDGEFDRADEFCEQVLNTDPKCALAYLGKLMSELRVKTRDELKICTKPFGNSANYQKVMRFADENLKNTLIGYIDQINQNVENNKKDEILYEAIKKIETDQKDELYSAIHLLDQIPGWKNADEQKALCERRVTDLEEKEAAEQEQVEEKIFKRNKKIVIITFAIAFVLTLVFIMVPYIKTYVRYKDAIENMEYGEYTYAYNVLRELDGYKDSAEKIEECRELAREESLKNCSVDSIVTFGTYEQDNKTENGNELIEWRVLEIKDGKALVISNYIVDMQVFDNGDNNGEVTWENSTLRSWLNNEFINEAFTDEEREMILTTTVKADKNPRYDNVDAGNDTEDKIFLLNIDEANEYFDSNDDRKSYRFSYTCDWWLRTPGYSYYATAVVNDSGTINENGVLTSFAAQGVRPAMWIEIE